MTSTSSPAFHGEGGDIPLTEQPAVEHIMSPADEHSKQHSDVTVTKDETAVESSIKFSPPLYKQRYDCVSAILRQEQVISVCDYGCAEGRALAVFRSVDTIQRLIGVDVDRKLLVDYCRRLDPLISDFLFRRRNPLHIELFHGSLLDYDYRLNDIDAVTLIEVVEHLNEADLAKLPNAVFGVVAPRLAVVTTPNAEFNVLFPSLTGFRHPDHKFEWTRHEFQQWCTSIASEYSYAVVFGGIGDPPEQFVTVGHCTQYAVFTRQQTNSNKISTVDSTCAPYECIHVVDYPVADRPATVEEAVLTEAQYYISVLARHQRARNDEEDDYENIAEDDVAIIEVADLMSFTRLQQACNNDAELLGRVLRSAGYSMSDDGLRIHYDTCRSHWDSDGDDDCTYDETSEEVAPVNSDVSKSLVTESEMWD